MIKCTPRHRAFRLAASCGGALCVAVAVSATTSTAGDASAQQATDGGARDSAPADASRAACSFQASGAATSHGACSVRIIFEVGRDGSGHGDGFAIVASSAEIHSATAWLRFMRGPSSGAATPGSYGSATLPFVGKATIVGANGIEWFGNAGLQGTFRLSLTSARRFRTEAGTSLELHGTLELELPPANLMARHPSAPPHPPLIFRASF